MVIGLLLNHDSTAETIDFRNHAKKVANCLPLLDHWVSYYGVGTGRGLEIRGKTCQQIEEMAQQIMSIVPFPEKLTGVYTLEFHFKPDKKTETS